MKTNLSILSGMIIGSVLAVLATFLIQPAFLNTAVSGNSQELISKELEPTEKQCDEICLNTIIDDLIAGTNLSDEYGIAISKENARKVAEKLQTQPETIKKITATLSSLKGRDDREAILFTFSYLPINQIERVIKNLLSSTEVEDRFDALGMIYNVENASDKTAAILQNVIQKDTDDELVIDAIQILFELRPDQVGNVSLQKLNQLLNPEIPAEIRSRALESKAHIFEANDEIKQDILSALNSSEQSYNETGLQLLDNIMNRQSNGETNGAWRSDASIRKIVEGIANDKSAAPLTRIEALHLMRRHYF